MPHTLDYAERWRKRQIDPDFFGHVTIAPDGGFSEVPDLWSRMRWLFALLSVVFAYMNVRANVATNLGLLREMGEDWFPLECADLHEDCTRPMASDDCMSNSSTNASTACCACGGGHEHLRMLLADHIAAAATRVIHRDANEYRTINPIMIVAVLEIGLMCLLIGRILITTHEVATARLESQRWHAVVRIFVDLIPQVQTMSSMRLLNYIAPGVVVPALMLHINRALGRHCSKAGLPILYFLLTRLAAGVIGFDAFLVKFEDVAKQFRGEGGIFAAVVFLNQLLGIVQVGWFVQMRLFIFIFGGEDGVMSEADEMRMKTWQAMLAREVYRRFGFSGRFFAIMLSYADGDFQKLALNDSKDGISGKDGMWVDEEDNSKHRIKGSRLISADGSVARITVTGPLAFVTVAHDGEKVFGQLIEDSLQIAWSSGAVWHRDAGDVMRKAEKMRRSQAVRASIKPLASDRGDDILEELNVSRKSHVSSKDVSLSRSLHRPSTLGEHLDSTRGFTPANW